MALYLISYDAHQHRDYAKLYELMEQWSCKRLLESVWLAQLRGPAEVVQSIVSGTLDSDDAVAVIELEPTAEWATIRAQQAGVDWLWKFIPFRA